MSRRRSRARSPLNTYTNQEKISKYQTWGARLSIAGIVFLVVSAVLLFVVQDQLLAWIPLLLGVLVAGAGSYFINRWTRPPRPEKTLPDTLSFLDSWSVLFNHYGPVPHLLLTPRGLIVLHSKGYEGPVRYDDKNDRWKGQFSLRRFYGQGMTAETVGNPSAEAATLEQRVREWLIARLGQEEAEQVRIDTIVLFNHPKATVEVEAPPLPLATPGTLPERVREVMARYQNMPRPLYRSLRAELEAEAPEDARDSARE